MASTEDLHGVMHILGMLTFGGAQLGSLLGHERAATSADCSINESYHRYPRGLKDCGVSK